MEKSSWDGLQMVYTVVTCNFEDVFFTDALQFSLPTLYTVKRPESWIHGFNHVCRVEGGDGQVQF